MGEVKHRAVVKASREKVFAYIDDYRNVPDYMFGLSRFAPTTDVDHGVGAIFEVVIKVGPKELKSTVKCVEWVENERIRLESISGLGADTEWTFTDGDAPGMTVLDAVFGYAARRDRRKGARRTDGTVRRTGRQIHRRQGPGRLRGLT